MELPDHDPTLTPEPTPEPTPLPQPPVLHRILFGKDGLRAGWGLLIFLVLLVAVGACARAIGHIFHKPTPETAPGSVLTFTPLMLLVGEATSFLAVLLVTWIMSKIERRPNSVYGLGGSRKLPHFFAGLGWGVGFLSLLILTLWKTGLLVIEGRLLYGSNVLRYGAIWLIGFLMVGLFEEYFSRGYLQYTLSRGLAGIYQWVFKTSYGATLGFWTSAVIFSFLFGLGHKGNPGESPIGLVSAGLVAMVFCLSLWRTGSLWWAIGFHAGWDWAQSFLYGVADSGTMVQNHLLATHPVGKPILSGGATGPEGSIFVVAILALVTVIIFLTLPRTQPRETAT